MTVPNDAERRGSLEVSNEVARSILHAMMFERRGLSKRTVQALANRNIDAPERLLFMTKAQLQSIPGAGKTSLAESKPIEPSLSANSFARCDGPMKAVPLVHCRG
jgi:DNA-directed RNA polymerase alpha subunit